MLKIMRKLLNLDRNISHLEERYAERETWNKFRHFPTLTNGSLTAINFSMYGLTLSVSMPLINSVEETHEISKQNTKSTLFRNENTS